MEKCEILIEHFPLISEHEEFFPNFVANCVFNTLLCYTATTVNVVAIYAIRKTSSLPKTLKTLLVSLAISDVGVGLLAQPFYSFFLIKWARKSDSDCVIYWALLVIMNFVSAASFFGVLAISVDRFLAISLHLRYQQIVTDKRVVAAVISVWMVSALASPLVLWLESDTHHMLLTSVGLIGFLITALVYIKMYLVLRRHRNDIEAFQVQQVTQDNGEIVNFSRLRKSAVGTFYVYLTFLVCYMPCAVCLAAFTIYGPITILKKFFLYSWTLMFLNSSLNPVIFCWKMRHIRRTVINILRKMVWQGN